MLVVLALALVVEQEQLTLWLVLELDAELLELSTARGGVMISAARYVASVVVPMLFSMFVVFRSSEFAMRPCVRSKLDHSDGSSSRGSTPKIRRGIFCRPPAVWFGSGRRISARKTASPRVSIPA